MTDVFTYQAPALRAQLLDLLDEQGPSARVMAGGTDVMIDMRAGFAHPKMVVDREARAGLLRHLVERRRRADHPAGGHAQRDPGRHQGSGRPTRS